MISPHNPAAAAPRRPVLCTSLAGYDYRDCRQVAAQSEMAEIRIDTMTLAVEQTEELFQPAPVPLIAACRAGKMPDARREQHLRTAIHAGAAYVDVEIDAPYKERLLRDARTHGSKVILSYHHFDGTPPSGVLQTLVRQMRAWNPDVLKIVPYARSSTDSLRVLALYETEPNLLAFCMGAAGRFSRIAAGLLGAPFVYAFPDNGKPSADGQLSVSQLKTLFRILHTE